MTASVVATLDTPLSRVYGRAVTLVRTAFANHALARVLWAWAATSLSVWAFTILFALAAYDAGGTTALGLAVAVRTLPAALGGPYGALLADRHARRDVLLLGLVVRAVLLAGLGLALTAGAGLVAICALGALFTLTGVAHKPAQSALMTALARTPAELAAANVLTTSLEYAGFLAGALLVGAAAGLLGVDVAMLVSVVPLAAAALVILGVPRDTRPEALPDQTAGMVPELLGGVRAVISGSRPDGAHRDLRRRHVRTGPDRRVAHRRVDRGARRRAERRGLAQRRLGPGRTAGSVRRRWSCSAGDS